MYKKQPIFVHIFKNMDKIFQRERVLQKTYGTWYIMLYKNQKILTNVQVHHQPYILARGFYTYNPNIIAYTHTHTM